MPKDQGILNQPEKKEEKPKEEMKRKENARTKAATKGKIGADQNQHIGGEWKFQKDPQFLKDRVNIWTELYEKQIKIINEFPQDKITVKNKTFQVSQQVQDRTIFFSFFIHSAQQIY